MINTLKALSEVFICFAASGCLVILFFMILIRLYLKITNYPLGKAKNNPQDYADISDKYYYGKQSKLEPEEWMNYTE